MQGVVVGVGVGLVGCIWCIGGYVECVVVVEEFDFGDVVVWIVGGGGYVYCVVGIEGGIVGW